MNKFARTVTAMLLIVAGIAASSASGSSKQRVEQQGAAGSGKAAGQENTTSVSRPNPDASGIYHVGDGVTTPQVIYSVDPEFSDKARKKKLNGTCVVGLVVDSSGAPQDVHLVKSAAEGVSPKLRSAAECLDEKAVEAVKQYKFKPGMYQGKPVPVELKIEVAFRIY